jgi:hypothetical protein
LHKSDAESGRGELMSAWNHGIIGPIAGPVPEPTWTEPLVPIIASELVDLLSNEDDFNTLCSEMFWSKDYDSTKMEELADSFAVENKLDILDPENLDKELYDAYKNNQEKGLS